MHHKKCSCVSLRYKVQKCIHYTHQHTYTLKKFQIRSPSVYGFFYIPQRPLKPSLISNAATFIKQSQKLEKNMFYGDLVDNSLSCICSLGFFPSERNSPCWAVHLIYFIIMNFTVKFIPSHFKTVFFFLIYIYIYLEGPGLRALRSRRFAANEKGFLLTFFSSRSQNKIFPVCLRFERTAPCTQRGWSNYSTYSIECYVWEKKWFTECNNKTYVA